MLLFAVPLQQAPLQQQKAASSSAAKATPKPDAKQLDRRIEGALGEVEAARREAANAKEAAGHELALMRRQLASAQSSHAAATKVCLLLQPLMWNVRNFSLSNCMGRGLWRMSSWTESSSGEQKMRS